MLSQTSTKPTTKKGIRIQSFFSEGSQSLPFSKTIWDRSNYLFNLFRPVIPKSKKILLAATTLYIAMRELSQPGECITKKMLTALFHKCGYEITIKEVNHIIRILNYSDLIRKHSIYSKLIARPLDYYKTIIKQLKEFQAINNRLRSNDVDPEYYFQLLETQTEAIITELPLSSSGKNPYILLF